MARVLASMVPDLIAIARVAPEVRAVAVVDEREDAARHGHARLALVSRFLACLPVGVDLPPLLDVQRLAALVVLERRTLKVHAQYAPSAPNSSAATASSTDWSSESAAERTREPYESLQCPKDRNPIFFNATSRPVSPIRRASGR